MIISHSNTIAVYQKRILVINFSGTGYCCICIGGYIPIFDKLGKICYFIRGTIIQKIQVIAYVLNGLIYMAVEKTKTGVAFQNKECFDKPYAYTEKLLDSKILPFSGFFE
ncbi:MAG: hypothetical protein LKI53_05020 [Bacteroidales bacterium]|jgi:hypothetical protein|nr:hypothetical protein [Bacteroidales bacterium]